MVAVFAQNKLYFCLNNDNRVCQALPLTWAAAQIVTTRIIGGESLTHALVHALIKQSGNAMGIHEL